MARKIPRTIVSSIQELMREKIILLSGPRQVGKTFLSKMFLSTNYEYLNFDDEDDRQIIAQKSWPRDVELLILDELHKKDKWKRWIKGIYDKEKVTPNLLVTGSARLDTFRKGGDSLAGRHYHFRLHPFSVKEVGHNPDKNIIENFLKYGNFPEPFLMKNVRKAKLWRKSHLDRILREDLLDLENVTQIKKIEILVQLLSERVGSQISYASLARDLEVSAHTVKHWIQILENLNVIFIVTPYSKNIAKAVLKAPKIYFYDVGRVRGDQGQKIENVVACHLLKRNHFLEDTLGERLELGYVKDTNQREVDFVTIRDFKVEKLIEVKLSDGNISNSLKYFHEKLLPKETCQLVFEIKRRKQFGQIKIEDLTKYLFELET